MRTVRVTIGFFPAPWGKCTARRKGTSSKRAFSDSFGTSTKIERDVIARGVFTSVKDLARKLMRYIKRYNQHPKPIKWRYSDPSRRIRFHGSASPVTGN